MTLSIADRNALASTLTIDLTTIGRRSGQPVTVEIWWFHVDDRFIITGTPGPRDWLANIRSNPEVVVSATGAHYRGRATEIQDSGFRRRVFTDPRIGWYRTQEDLDTLIEAAPMIEVVFG